MTNSKEWLPGCYGLRSPATIATADAVIYRENKQEWAEILLGKRGEGRWGSGLWMLGIGGFIDPNDNSALETVRRELNEEVPGITFELEEAPFCLAGPRRYKYYWDTETRTAVRERELAQDIPLQNMTFLARWRSGVAQPTKEVTLTRWDSLRELSMIDGGEFFTDQALILEALVKRFYRNKND